MSSSAPLTNIDPRPISNSPVPYQEPFSQRPGQSPPQGSYGEAADYYPQQPYPSGPYSQAAEATSVPGIALHLGPESQIPDHPGSEIGVPQLQQAITPLAPLDIRTLRTSCQFGLREYVSLMRKRQRYDASTATVDLESRIRAHSGVVLGDLRLLQDEVRGLVKAGENHRWRKWVIGGAM